MKPNRQKAAELYDKLTNGGDGVTYQMLLEFILNDHMDGQQAVDALLAAQKEFFYSDVETETYRSSDWDDDDYDDDSDED
jgi:hypothetical protein